jgi:hypothetical protein
VQGVGLTVTNSGSGFRFSGFCNGGIALGEYTSTALCSNALKTFLAAIHPKTILVSSKDTPEWMSVSLPQFVAITRQACPDADVINLTPHPSLDPNGGPLMVEQRAVMLSYLSANNLPCVDAWAWFAPTNAAVAQGLFWDGVHLSVAGQRYKGDRFCELLNLYQSAPAATGITTNITVSPSSGTLSLQFSNGLLKTVQ